MNYIYAIICHRLTNPLEFTVSQLLEDKKNIIIIHIDAKTNADEIIKIHKTLGINNNVYIIPQNESIEIRWGHVSQIETMLLLMKKALNYNFQYFSLISGDDIPITSNQARNEFLLNSYKNEIEFIGNEKINNASERLAIKYPSFFFKKDQTLLTKIYKKVFLIFAKKISRNNLLEVPKLYKGSNWFTLSDKAILYIMDYLEKHPKYLEQFKYSFCCDEVFFHTIIFNSSKFKSKVNGIDSNLSDCEMGGRYIDWKTGPEFPKILNESDLDKVSKSNLLFARKFRHDAPLALLTEFIKD